LFFSFLLCFPFFKILKFLKRIFFSNWNKFQTVTNFKSEKS
jgi:hypothetical protein